MGCLLFPFELLFEVVIEGWFYLMQLIIPKSMQNKTVRIILKLTVGVFSFLLALCMLLSFFDLISDDYYTHLLGKYLLFFPLGLSIIQIVFGIIVRIRSKNKYLNNI